MSKYLDLLINNKWKRKRQKILKRDNYVCTVCGTKKGLQVHHTFYYKNAVNPWQYPNESLLTICKDCHKTWHEYNEIEYKDNPIIGKKNKKKIINPERIKKKKVERISLAQIQTKEPRYKIRE
jgi:5-methylcytosine-specific restriction endonuclease McrA